MERLRGELQDFHHHQGVLEDERAASAATAAESLVTEQLAALEQRGAAELARLQQHLLELEETHTQETMKLELALQEYKSQASHMVQDRQEWEDRLQFEQEAARAAVMKLEQTQLQLHEAREEIQALHAAAQAGEAAMGNLSEVLEQLQISRDVQIKHATESLASELEARDYALRELEQQLLQERVGALRLAFIVLP